MLELLLRSDAPALLLDEPDNFLDIPAKRELERQIRASGKTVLLISHDRGLLSAACDSILTLEGDGCWVHGESYATYPEARAHRQQLMGDRLGAGRPRRARLREIVRRFKERASYAPDWAKRADAAETRWRRFVDEGPPEAPVVDAQITPAPARRRLGAARNRAPRRRDRRAGRAADRRDPLRRARRARRPQRHRQDPPHAPARRRGRPPRGPLRARPARLARALHAAEHARRVRARDAARGRDRAARRDAGGDGRARALRPAGRRAAPCATLSGGQRARLEILCLELEGHNLLLLDEPTDNLDIESSEALETALEGFEGTIVAVSHDRAFLRTLDRFLLLDEDGDVTVLPDPERALAALG